MSEDIAASTADELVSAYAARELSPVDATWAALDAIDAYNDEYRAFCLVDREGALAAAEASERRWLAGEPAGPLDGVPCSIKDLHLTRGWPTLRGCRRVDPGQQWNVDGPAVERLRRGGAVLLGKTTTPEFGWKGTTDNAIDGHTRNPWDPTMTAGGSSGGSGAALSAGMGAIALATDGAGSARIPASFCGVVGFKPSYGRIPMFPPSDLGTLAHAGVMARSVRDIALMMEVLAGADPRDPGSLPGTPGTDRARTDTLPPRVHVAFSADLGYAGVDREVAAVVDRAVSTLAERDGVSVETADPPLGDPLDPFTVLWSAGMARLLDTQLAGSVADIEPGLAALIERGGRYTTAQYLGARRSSLDIAVRMAEFHQRHDILVTPTTPIPAFEVGYDLPPGSGTHDWPEWTPFTYPFNMSMQPALSVPVGFTSRGLPVGLQVVGPRLADHLVLAVGAAMADAVTTVRTVRH